MSPNILVIDLDAVANDMISGLAAIVMATIGGGLWARRRRPIDRARAGLDQLTQLQTQRTADDHAKLVSFVLQRAGILNIRVPIAVRRSNHVVTVTFHPDDTHYYVTDLPHYRRLIETRQLPPTRTFREAWSQPPASRWSDAQLRQWLADHTAQLPPMPA